VTDSIEGCQEDVWIVNLELTNSCNLKCVFCDHPEWKKKFSVHDMDDELLGKIMDDCQSIYTASGAKIHELGLVGLGEPTLNRSLERHLRMIGEYAETFDRISINSNLVSLREKHARLLLSSKVNAYTFSVNASNRETYREMMQVDVFDRVIENLRGFLRLLKDNREPVRVDVQLFNSDENDLEVLKALLPEATSVDVNFFVRNVYTKPILMESDLLRLHKPSEPCRYPCWDIYSRIYVDVEGFLYPCTVGNDVYREDSHLCLGNVRSDTIADLFNGEKNQAARRRAEEGDLPFPECEPCNIWSLTPNNFNWNEHGKVWEKSEAPTRAYKLKNDS
jgi:radical SAM protein with 4Fe4S-binding SPASM domain